MRNSYAKLSILSCGSLLISGVLFSSTPAVSAELSWDWSYKCSFETFSKCEGGSGTFTTTEQQGHGGGEYYLVTGMTGTVEGNTITSLLPPNSLGNDNDNKLSTPLGGPFINTGSKVTGIAFITNNDPPTSENVNLLYNILIDRVVGYYTQITGPNNLFVVDLAFSDKKVDTAGNVPVPEPDSLLIYVTMGALLLGNTIRKAFRYTSRAR